MEKTDTQAAAAERSHPDPAGRQRVIVERIEPEIDGGRFPIKRTPGESVFVTVDLFADGHDLLAGVVRYRVAAPAGPDSDVPGDGPAWQEVPLAPLGNDRWGAAFPVSQLGVYEYTVEGWVDRFGSWVHALAVKADAGQDVASELIEGAEIVHRAASRSSNGDGLRLLEYADRLRSQRPQWARVAAAREAELEALMASRPDRSASTTYERVLRVVVDSTRARFSAWYEMFPRSSTPDPTRSGTFREAESRLPDIAAMGFDVVYLPPIHPIGRTHRKGRNNTLIAEPGDPGSPWAIGAAEGGHTAVEPGLGTIADFERFVAVANRLGLEVALDIAFQASPDHPWVREHPEWFRHRPDGSIKYAENPPKKYQDIYPLDFDAEAWPSLWDALRDVFLFWIGHGVKTFRVDNPHTKGFRFWEWAIADIQRRHPDTVFLAEAFTRPKVMRYLAKAGFSQSYTYFTWRNTAPELREYLTELTRTELQEYMRPNFFANTPDILHEFLQTGGRAAFELRLILAATLAAAYGIYSGYELCESDPVRPGSEEYLDSEKYQFKPRDFSRATRMRELIARVNQIRRDHPSLQQNATLAFHETDNGAFLFYSKTGGQNGVRSGSGSDRVFVVANNDVHWAQEGWVHLPLWDLGIDARRPFIVEDLLDGARYTWRGEWNYVKLDPRERVAHLFVIRG
jgi:starch synthase (maltosyl-transferring)